MNPSIIVIGAAGRMGSTIVDMAGEDGFEVAARVDRRAPAGEAGWFPEVAEALAAVPGAVVLDVSSPDDAEARVEAVRRAGRPLVEGTTALGSEVEAALNRAAGEIPVVVAPNFGPGIALLRRALGEILSAAGPRWDVAILDRHHRMKRDAPSGTAKLLARAAGDRGVEAQVASFRQGGVVGEHAVHLSADDEELVLTHRAFSRRAFARGALLAARFAASAGPGRYGMDDVLGA
jgi:4-hydroxy-tetrahydrodipicolinate reductase